MVGASGILCIEEKFLNNCWKKSENKEKPSEVGGPMSFTAITHSVYGRGEKGCYLLTCFMRPPYN